MNAYTRWHARGVLRLSAVAAVSAWLCVGWACSKGGGGAPTEAAPEGALSERPAPTLAPGERRWPITGEVVSVDPKGNTIRLRHNEVKGYMPAMTMDFAAAAGDCASVRPGEKLRADLIVGEKGHARLERIWPDDQVSLDTVDAGLQALREDTHNRGRSVYREIGESVPGFVLYDQNGQVVRSDRFRGKQVMLNFIYTRCPIADMCPASTLKMMSAQKLARAAGVTGIEFVSITLDPANDTPGTLRTYADERGIDTSNFSFLTGPEAAIRNLLAQFGVIAEFEGDIVKHTLTTLLIDEQGHIKYRADGSVWEPKDFVERMHRG